MTAATVSKTRPEQADAYRYATRQFLAGERLEMGRLATELGVSRMTVHRWVGDRSQLLSDVMWSLLESTLDRLAAEIPPGTPNRVADVAAEMVASLMTNHGMRSLLDTEGELAARIMTSPAGTMQSRVIAYYESLLDQEREAGMQLSALSANELAYLIVRIAESYVYKEVITGESADSRNVQTLFRRLLTTSTH